MAQEIPGPLRAPGARHVARCRDNDARRRADPQSDEGRVDERPDAERDVEAVGEEVYEVIAQREVQPHLRMAGEERGHEGRQVTFAEDDGRAHS